MYYIGLDVASKSSFVHVIDGRGKKIETKEIPTDKDSYRQYFRPWAKKPVRVLDRMAIMADLAYRVVGAVIEKAVSNILLRIDLLSSTSPSKNTLYTVLTDYEAILIL